MADPTSRKRTNFEKPAIRAYLESLHSPLSPAESWAFETSESGAVPAIQLAASEAKFLELMASIIGARRVIEIGTLVGFSGLHLLAGMPEEGHLWTLEIDRNHAEIARETFSRAGAGHRVSVVEGDAMTSLSNLEEQGPFDLVFIDADKGRYDLYGDWAIDNLRPGGVLLADNAYLFGELLSEGAEAAAMRRFHERMAGALNTSCLPTPDGLLVGVKTVSA